jgi:peptidoglycan/xylan/chitin deacetylase (PgdA/CDA1 family)
VLTARAGCIVLLAVLVAACGSTAAPVHHVARERHRERRAQVSLVKNATPQPGWMPYLGPVPILVYHNLGAPPPGEPYAGLYQTDQQFQQEIAWLDQQGYQGVTLDEVMDAWFHGGTLPAKPIVITFDNGYLPQVTFAPSVLSRYGWPGVLNEITQNHLNHAHIEHVLKLGWEVDSHSVTHPDLTAISAAALTYQVDYSRTFLRKTFHIPVNSFCYPSSKYNAAAIAAVRADGYTSATTEGNMYATRADPFLLPRFEIEGGLPELQHDLADHLDGA